MTADTLDMFGVALQEMANGPRLSSYQELTEGVLRRLSEKGLTLAQCADRRILNRSPRTLEEHCRSYGIAFPDYVPANMRKHVRFLQRGDFLELDGDLVREVAGLLDITVTKRDGVESCAIPAHAYEDAKAKLKAGWIEVSKAKAPKRKAAAHA